MTPKIKINLHIDKLWRARLFFLLLLLLLLSHLHECDSVSLATVAFFRCRNHFDKVFVRAVPVEIIKSVTTAKYNSSLFFIPLYGTATRQTSVRHWYSSMLSNLTVVYTALFYRNRNHNLVWGERFFGHLQRKKKKYRWPKQVESARQMLRMRRTRINGRTQKIDMPPRSAFMESF